MNKGNAGAINIRAGQVAAEYGIAAQTLANWRSQGKGPDFMRVSARMVLYSRGALEKFFTDHKITPGRAAG
jgi:transposase-like protein